MTSTRDLDFIVIGAQKGGTTSLWEYLRRHPQIAMPDYKEAPVFCAPEERLDALLAGFMRSSFAGAPPGAKLGKAATHYMRGAGAVDVDRVAARIAARYPRIRLIALLRDPIDRAASQYRMLRRRGVEEREFGRLVDEELAPSRLAAARAAPGRTNSYLIQGEYGRIMDAYGKHFPADQIHVEYTADLASDPAAVLDRVLSFVGLAPGYRPDGLGVRHHVGGVGPLLEPEAEAALRKFMVDSIWPRMDRPGQAERAFDFFLQTWNVAPDDFRPSLSPPLRDRLKAHYRADGALLRNRGIATPWLRMRTGTDRCARRSTRASIAHTKFAGKFRGPSVLHQLN